jgi:hypothetical protein
MELVASPHWPADGERALPDALDELLTEANALYRILDLGRLDPRRFDDQLDLEILGQLEGLARLENSMPVNGPDSLAHCSLSRFRRRTLLDLFDGF